MRIPTYTAGSQMTSEAPGRSFRTRANAQPFVQQAQAQNVIAGAVIGQAAEFTAMRYKAARETQVNEKLLAGEEALRQEALNLSKIETGKLRNVFNEGGKEEEGLWSQASKATREKLLEDVKDREARRILTDRFNQMELTQRFSLRNTIDQNIEKANTAARAARANSTVQNLATVTSAAEFDLIASNFGIDSVRMGQLGLGNPEALKKQELAVITSGVTSNLMQAIQNSDTPSRDLENIRLAIRDNDPNLAGKNQLQLALLQKLPLQTQAQILQSLGTGAGFIDAASAEEQKTLRIQKNVAKTTAQQITSYTEILQKGGTLPGNGVADLANLVNQVSPFVDGVEAAQLQEGLADLQYIQDLSSSIKTVTNLTDLDGMIMSLETGDTMGGPGLQARELLGLDFLRGFRANMDKQLKKDPIGFASATGAVKVAAVDLSPEAIQRTQETGEDQTGAQKRILAAIQTQGHYNLSGPIQILTPAEAADYAPRLNTGTAVERMQAINDITQLFGDYAPAVMAQIAPNAPVTAHVAGLMQDGQLNEAEIIMNGISEIEANGSPLVGADKASVQEVMFKVLGTAFENLPGGVNADLKKNISDTAEAYYAEVISRRVNKEFDEVLWDKAVRAASGYNSQTGTGGVQDVSGTPTLLPSNRSADEVNDAIDNITYEAFNDIAADGVIDEKIFKDFQDQDYSIQVLGKRNGKMVYGLFDGEYGASEYAMLTDEAGTDISFTMEDLVNASRKGKPVKKSGGYGAGKSDRVIISDLAQDLSNSDVDLNDIESVKDFIRQTEGTNTFIRSGAAFNFIRSEAATLRGE
jgi:hypothetical protein